MYLLSLGMCWDSHGAYCTRGDCDVWQKQGVHLQALKKLKFRQFLFFYSSPVFHSTTCNSKNKCLNSNEYTVATIFTYSNRPISRCQVGRKNREENQSLLLESSLLRRTFDLLQCHLKSNKLVAQNLLYFRKHILLTKCTL